MQCEKILIPWETFVLESSKKQIDFHAHLEIDHELARFFKAATSIGRRRLEGLGRQFSYCDEICVAVAICPESIIVCEKVIRGAVELQGKFTRGQVALAWVFEKLREEAEDPMNELRFVINYHVENLDKLMYETIYRCTEKAKLNKDNL